MMHLTDLVALLGIDVVICAVLMRVFSSVFPIAFKANASSGHFNGRLAVVLIALLACFWIPAGPPQLPLLAYVRGVGADLSTTAVLLACMALYRQLWGRPEFRRSEYLWVFAVTASGALLLYPTALGWGDWDAYRAGWGSYAFLVGIAITAFVGFFAGLWLLPLVLATCLLAWTIGLMESGNVWDYLLDPWLVLFACWNLLAMGIAFARRRLAER